MWGRDYLPHDAKAKDPKSGKSAEQVLFGLGRKVEVMPRLDVESGIRAVRMLLPRVYIDDTDRKHDGTGYRGCSRLLTCLKRYRRSVPEATGEPGNPVHDEYSHGADAVRGLAVIIDKIRNENDKPKIPYVRPTPLSAGTGL